MINLDDEKIVHLADVLGNKTCKRILEYLADKEASETEIARDLNLPANTVNYNIKKLVDSGLVEKSRNFFWSVKGKKIVQYSLSNKKVIISPITSSATKSVLGAFLATGIGALLIKLYTGSIAVASSGADKALAVPMDTEMAAGERAAEIVVAESAPRAVERISSSVGAGIQMPELALIFLAGGLFALIIFMILNYRRL